MHDEQEDRDSSTHIVHSLMQFALTVRYRKNVVILCLMVSFFLGALYFLTATRYYGATAAMLVMQTGADMVPNPVGGGTTRSPNSMRTYCNLMTQPKVLEGAFDHLGREDLVDLEGVPQETRVFVLKENLHASEIRGTNIMEISYRSKDPHAAVNVVNAVIQSYDDFLNRTHKGTAGEAIDVLTRQRLELAKKLARHEQKMIAARQQSGTFGIRSGSQTVHPLEQRAIYFNEELIKTKKQRVQLQASLGAIEASIRNGEDLQQHVMTMANVVGREILLSTLGLNSSDAQVQGQLERTLLDERAELKSLDEHLGPAHPEVIAKVEKIRMTENYLRSYQDRIRRRLQEIQYQELGPMLVRMVQQKLNEVWQLETSLRVSFEEAHAKATSLTNQRANLEVVEHEVQRLRKLDDTLLDKIAGIDLKQGGPEVRTAVVHEPVLSEKPILPNLRNVLLLSLVGGLGVGLLVVYVLDILDDRFRSVEEMQVQLGVPVLALVRQLPTSEATGLESLQAYAAPNSTESEAFRTLRTALALADGDNRQIVVSSPEPGDGKTTLIANLGVAYAQSGKKTLLVDADLRRPGLTATMGMRGVDGLSGVVRGQQDVVQMAAAHIRATGMDGLDILPSGPRPPNPAELLSSTRFSEFLAWAESLYDQIFIDSPPALATSDAAVIGRLADGVVLVVQPDKNCRRQVIRAADSLAVLKIPLLGLVVNRVGSDRDRGYYGYSAGYGYRSGYNYLSGYAHDEDEPSAEPPDNALSNSQDIATVFPTSQGQAPTGVVPRRVA